MTIVVNLEISSVEWDVITTRFNPITLVQVHNKKFSIIFLGSNSQTSNIVSQQFFENKIKLRLDVVVLLSQWNIETNN